jgi:hypothetical protein
MTAMSTLPYIGFAAIWAVKAIRKSPLSPSFVKRGIGLSPFKKGGIEGGFLQAVGDKLPEKTIVEQSDICSSGQIHELH